MSVIIPFNKLKTTDLHIDTIYEGGNAGNAGDDPIHQLLGVANSGGFRIKGRSSDLSMPYIALYTSGENLDWPDKIDYEQGVFRYYGDNKSPGKELHKTKKNGNALLNKIFTILHTTTSSRSSIPPIFLFKKHPTANSNRSVQFKGLCVPGVQGYSSKEDLIAVWKTKDNSRFQNYLAYFTILDVETISREWIEEITIDYKSKYMNAPKAYKDWIVKGTYKPLKAPRTVKIRSENEQMPDKSKHIDLLTYIYEQYKDNPTDFEYFAAAIYKQFAKNVEIDEITQKSVDGGIDAKGHINIGLDSDKVNITFILEAKCFNPGYKDKNRTRVGVKGVSRLISRLRNNYYGILVTTSAVNKQTYKEIREDQHPIIIISGKDIIDILLENGYSTKGEIVKFIENSKNIV